MAKRKKLGLALSGGGARGLAHVGFLEVLDEAGVEVAAISGTSIGAVIGAGYAIYSQGRILEEVFDRFLESELFHKARFDFLNEVQKKREEDRNLLDWLGGKMRKIIFQGIMLTRSGLLSDEIFQEIIEFFIPEVTFDQTKIPLACAALDLVDGGRWSSGRVGSGRPSRPRRPCRV